jgi:hypothetical protein
VNCYVEAIGEEGKLQYPIYAADGFTSRSALSGGGATAAMLSLNDSSLYVVSGSRLFKNTSDNTTTNLAALTCSGWAVMGRNRKASTPQIGILSDSGNFSVLENDTLTTISEAFLTNLVDFVSFDGFGLLFRSDGEFYITSTDAGAVSDNFNAWDALFFASVESSPYGINRALTRGDNLVIFTPRGCEFWSNTGQNDFPLERVTSSEIGCYAPRAAREVVIPGEGGTTDSIIWPATDSNGAYIGVMAMNGYGGSKISNHAVDRSVQAESSVNQIRAVTWAEGGHTFYGLHTSTQTWVYDLNTGLWHERSSSGIGRWRVQEIAHFNRQNIAGDYSTGNIYTMGPGTVSASTSAVAVRSSKNNGDAWVTNETKTIGGAADRDQEFKFTRFGQSRKDGFIVEVTITNAVDENGTGNTMTIIPPHLHAWPNPLEISAIYVDVIPGSSQTSVPKAITGMAADVSAVPFT